MIIITSCTKWRREFLKHGIPFTHQGNARFFEHENDDIGAPLIVYKPDDALIFSWRGGSLLEVYSAPTGNDVVEPLSCFQVAGKTNVPGELSPCGGWPTTEDIMLAIEEFKKP